MMGEEGGARGEGGSWWREGEGVVTTGSLVFLFMANHSHLLSSPSLSPVSSHCHSTCAPRKLAKTASISTCLRHSMPP